MPLAASSQIAPERSKHVEQAESPYKWEAFAGYGYTSLNQVNQSRYGLQGVNLSLTRDWGKYFGLTADGAYYSTPIASGNPGKPVVDVVLFGPVLHANITDHLSGFFRGLLGGNTPAAKAKPPTSLLREERE